MKTRTQIQKHERNFKNTNANSKTQTQIQKHKRKFKNTNANSKTQTQIQKHERKFKNTNANSKTQTQIQKHERKFKNTNANMQGNLEGNFGKKGNLVCASGSSGKLETHVIIKRNKVSFGFNVI
jgi:hypothetical protein